MNVHIYPSNFKNESRIEKQAQSISKLGIFKKILLLGAGSAEQPKQLSSDVELMLLGEDNRPSSILGKVKRFVKWYVKIVKYLKQQEVQCINAHSLSVLPLCVYLKKVKKAKLIYDAHELETETNSTGGIKKVLAKFVEKRLIGYADHVFVVSDSIAQFYQDLYQLDNIDVVLNAPVEKPQVSQNIFREKLAIADDTVIFLYQGVLSSGRGIEFLLEAFTKLTDRKACIVFMGYGALESEIQSYQAKYDNIFHFPAVAPADVHIHTSSADVGFALIENTCLSYNYCMPNKLFEYGMAGVPCLVTDLPEMKKYVRANNCGFVLPSLEQSDLIALVDEVMNSDLSEIKKNARAGAVANSWQQQEQVMIDVYTKIFGEGRDSNS